MVTTTERCAECGYGCGPSDAVCGMCGVLRRAPSEAGAMPPLAAPPTPERRGVVEGPGVAAGNVAPELDMEFDPGPDSSPGFGPPQGVRWLFMGCPLALLFFAGPFMRRWAWFLGALFHESGHTVAGLAFGLPSFPAIRLDGHAVTVHGEQKAGLVWMICAGIAIGAWVLRSRPVACAVVAICALVYPWIAFGSWVENLFLLGGHLGELAFATLCLHRAITGGFTHGRAERIAYSALGWLLVGSNVSLCAGLAWSQAARAWYHANGSLGLANDYVRLADRWGTSLATVGGWMLFVSVLPVVIAVGLSCRRR